MSNTVIPGISRIQERPSIGDSAFTLFPVRSDCPDSLDTAARPGVRSGISGGGVRICDQSDNRLLGNWNRPSRRKGSFFFVYFAVTKIFVKISMGYFILVLFAVFASVVSVFIGENIHQIVS